MNMVNAIVEYPIEVENLEMKTEHDTYGEVNNYIVNVYLKEEIQFNNFRNEIWDLLEDMSIYRAIIS
jgi:hypothetical protein